MFIKIESIPCAFGRLR